MRNRILALTTVSLLFVVGLLAPNVRADEENKKTVVTFNEPVQVPGTVLPAGTYVFKLADSQSDRNIIQIFNADETRLITTILAIPDYRNAPADKTILTFDERPSGEPEALQSWFYPGDNYGQEFVYPKKKATQLAQVSRRSVPSISDEVAEPATMATAPVTRITPTLAEPTPGSLAPSTPDASSTKTTVVAIEELPQTASPLASIALFGIVCLVAATALRCFSLAAR